MSGSRAKFIHIRFIFPSLILVGLALPVFAQNISDPVLSAPRAASFLPTTSGASAPATDFSGLASPPELVPPPVAPPSSPVGISVTAPLGAPVSVAPLPNISPESIGTQNADNLGAAMWKGTPRAVAEKLVSMADVTSSPVLNDLARRLLTNAAVPPDGNPEMIQSLTAMRVEKLVNFGDSSGAWALAMRADPKLIDDATFHLAAENMVAADSDSICPQLAGFAQNRTGADWQKALIICQLRAKDNKAAQVGLDVMRAQPKHDDMFLLIADKNVLSDGKILPNQLTPLSAPMLALLRATNLPLPGELYNHPDFALVPALLRAPAKEDVAQIGLGERAAQRGVISNDALAAVYKAINFAPEELAAPLTASEPAGRMRALLYRAAMDEKDPARRVTYTVKFMQATPPDLLNGAGGVLADMLGNVKADTAFQDSAVFVARIYMLANRGDMALEWYRLARGGNTHQDDLQNLWPQFVLAGLETDADYAADFDKWFGAVLKQSDPQADMRPTRDAAAANLMFLDAAGFKIPDAAWAKVLAAPQNEKRIAFSPVLLDRLHAAAADNRRAETILLAVGVADSGDIPLPVAVAITRALRLIGLKNEAASFACQMVALAAK